MINKLIPNSVKHKILSVAVIPAVVMCLILTAYFMYHRHETAMAHFHEKGEQIAKTLAAGSEYGLLSGNREYMESMINKVVSDPEIISVEILSQDGTLFVSAQDVAQNRKNSYLVTLPIASQVVDINTGDEEDDLNFDRFDPKDRKVVAKVIGKVNVKISPHLIRNKQIWLLLSGALLACFALVLSIYAGVKLAASIIDPIRVIMKAVSDIRSGNNIVDISISGEGEIEELADDVSALGNELEASKNRERKHLMEVTYARDVADRANTQKTRFMARLSHELKNSLNAVLLNTELLKIANKSEYLAPIIRVCSGAAKHLQNSLDNLVNQSMVDIGQLYIQNEYFNLKELIEDFVSQIDVWVKRKSLLFNLEYDISPELDDAYILSSPGRLRQILLNLVDNAVKFTREGEISLIVRLTKHNDTEAQLEISVRDTGIGIPKDQLEFIFEFTWQVDPILSRKKGGLGLGLSNVEKLTNALGGNILVESEESVGTCFNLTFNCVYSNEKKVVSDKEALDHYQKYKSDFNKKVLLIEDDEDNRCSVAMVLDHYGYTVDVAEDGFEGRSMFMQNNYDVVFIDCYMPKLDGYNCSRLIRQYETKHSDGKKAFLVALTAAVGKDSASRCYDAGIDKVIHKPYTVFDLMECLNDHNVAENTIKRYFEDKNFMEGEDDESNL